MRWEKYALIFLGTWGGLIAVVVIVEKVFHSGPPGGGTGMPPIPAAFVLSLLFGWIPAGIVTVVTAVKHRRQNPSQPPFPRKWWW